MSLTETFFLLFLGIAVAGIAILGFVVYFNDRKSMTNRYFLYFALSTAIWGTINYFTYNVLDQKIVLILIRLLLFFAIFQAYFFFKLASIFPDKNLNFSKKKNIITAIVALLVSLFSLSHFVFSGVKYISDKKTFETEVEPGIVLFSLTSVGFVFLGLRSLMGKIKKLDSVKEKTQHLLLFFGGLLMFLLIIVFNLVLPAFFNNTSYVPFGAVFVLPFIILTSYAIYRHKLFNLKVAYVGFIAFLLTIFSFFNIIYAQNTSQIILNVLFFVLILAGSIILIRTILREVEQKEEQQKLNNELRELIKQRENLVHLITHKVKGSFTRSKYIFAEVLEGTFGPISDTLKDIIKKGLNSDNEGIKTVDLVLHSVSMQDGTARLNMESFDLRPFFVSAIEEKKSLTDLHSLEVKEEIEEGEFKINGDKFWIKEAIWNLFDNAIKYTPEGHIIISLKKEGKKAHVSFKDTGIGISEEDRQCLFTEGGRGVESLKYNTDSTGYGLFTVKMLMERHGGRVWVDSKGRGYGSVFNLEFPLLD